MSNNGNAPVNTSYFEAMSARATAATSCGELQDLSRSVSSSVHGSINSANGRIAACRAQLTDLKDEVTTLGDHISLLLAAQTTTTDLNVVVAMAPAVNNLATAIAYIQAQGVAMTAQTNVGALVFGKQYAALLKQLNKVNHDVQRITSQIASVQAQVTQLPQQLGTFLEHAATASQSFDNCSL